MNLSGLIYRLAKNVYRRKACTMRTKNITFQKDSI